MKNQKHLLFWLIVFLFLVSFESCKKEELVNEATTESYYDFDVCDVIPGAECPPANSQRSGDPDAGYNYLINGDYIKSGLPYDLYLSYYGADPSNHLNRTGDNAVINYQYTAVDAPNGVRVVAPNCLQCHAQSIDGQFIVGLGNTTYDFTIDQSVNATSVEFGISLLYGEGSPEMEASENFLRALKAVGPYIVTDVRGVNPADKLATVLAAHRNPDDLSWNVLPSTTIPVEAVPSDVPAWWLLKKKYAMFYTGIGRKDFIRYMMASSLLTIDSSSEAEEIEAAFVDVMAYIQSIEAPAYPKSIDWDKAEEGKVLFENNCALCHGTYGETETYPNVLIPASYVGTDPYLAQSNYDQDYFMNWFNNSWFSDGDNAAELVASGAYIAPPLDGVWATAPYLHNGSVPTLDDLLNSSQRPTYWRRNFSTDDYDFDKVGWDYTLESGAIDSDTYNTTLPGYLNTGHNFGDALTDEEREKLIEYLKSL